MASQGKEHAGVRRLSVTPSGYTVVIFEDGHEFSLSLREFARMLDSAAETCPQILQRALDKRIIHMTALAVVQLMAERSEL